MRTALIPCVATLCSLFCLGATAETVTPLKGQSPETVQQDISACQAQAGSASSTNTTQSGGRARGAATGAVAGAVESGVAFGDADGVSAGQGSDCSFGCVSAAEAEDAGVSPP